ncbi:MAG: radical SAM family heme chaperone HemW [Pseudomonadota bacterium]
MQTPLQNSPPPAWQTDWRYGGFGVYVHWPFCAAKCPYCDFNSHVTGSVDHDAWANAMVKEITATAAWIPRRRVDTVFFGGGTPSMMAPRTVDRVLGAIARNWTLTDNAEITLEANPTSVEAEKFADFAKAGVNRVSIGVQALNDVDLRRLGRMHSTTEAIEAIEIARQKFERMSFDLIYARQDQTADAWASELGQALALGSDHLSLYQLTIEPGTVFGARHARGKLRGLPTDALAEDLYFATQDTCEAAGLPAYEVSNHARPGQESRHNCIYWRYGDYAGIGPGAHGRLTCDTGRWATVTPTQPSDWLSAVDRHGTALSFDEMLTPDNQATEYAMMGLRLAEGISLSRVRAMAPGLIASDAIIALKLWGLITQEGDLLRSTRKGRPLLNRVILELLSGD